MKIVPFVDRDWINDHPLGSILFKHLLKGEADSPDNFMYILGRQDGDFLMLKDLIGHILKKTAWNLNRKTKKYLPEVNEDYDRRQRIADREKNAHLKDQMDDQRQEDHDFLDCRTHA